MFDQITKNTHHTHKTVQKWIDYCEDNYAKRGKDGTFERVVMYRDPLKNKEWISNRFNAGILLSWYLLPQRPNLAYEMYQASKRDWFWDDDTVPVERLVEAGTVPMVVMSLVLAREFNDAPVARRLHRLLEAFAEPKFFGPEDSLFGFFFHLGERWPRGQLSALLMCSEVMEAGDWQRLFTNPSYHTRFSAPTVTGVDFPGSLGISQAWNDANTGVLHIRTYAATPSQQGSKTAFRVVNIPLLHRCPPPDSGNRSAQAVQARTTVVVDGQPYSDWAPLDCTEGGTMELRLIVGAHKIEVYTGYGVGGATPVIDTVVKPQDKDGEGEAKL